MASERARNVAIIGAGIAGLAALKECLAADLETEVFESRDEIGGQWAYQATPDENGEVQSSMYAGMVMNSCRDTTGFSDFPIDPARYGVYFTHREMHRYILEYADHFSLKKHIRLRTKVLSCAQREDGKWVLKLQAGKHQPEEKVYDAVISASGQNTAPIIPDFKGKDSFKGEFVHSHFYRTPGPYEGKRVVLIGSGSAAIDIASELAPACKEVHLVTRRGTWVLPRFVLGKPVEAWDSRSAQTWLPARLSEWVQLQLLNFVQGEHPPELRPDHRLMQQNPTIRTEFIERVRNGTIIVHRAEVAELTEDGITLSTGEHVEADAILCCTGYKRAPSYLPADVLRDAETPEFTLDLWKLIVPARHSNLYITGLIEGTGPSPPAMEAQARFVSAVLAGRVALPDPETRLREIRQWQAWHAQQFVHSERHINTETYIPYIDSLLKPLGAAPTFGRLLGRVFTSGHPLRALSVLNAVYFDVVSNAQWRLFGHGSNEDLAQATLLRTSSGKDELSAEEKKLLA